MIDNRTRVAEAIEFIETNLFEDLRLRGIAERAGLSPYHFHRTFQALAGETVAEYVKKRRLDAAADLLVEQDRRIIDIAMECGFGSQEAFSRAFSRAFGWTPGLFRKLKPPRKHYARIDAVGTAHRGSTALSPRLETIEERRVFGIGKRIIMDGYAGARPIMRLWKDFCRGWTKDLEPAEEFYGLGVYDLEEFLPDGSGFEYFACAPLAARAAPPEGYQERRIPGGLYAVFDYEGPVRRARDAFDYIFGTWFPRAPFRLRIGPNGSVGFERYRPPKSRGTVNRSMSVYVPIDPFTD